MISFYAYVAQYLWHKIRRQNIFWYHCIAHLAPIGPQTPALWLRPNEGTWLQFIGSVLYGIMSWPSFTTFFLIYTQTEPASASWNGCWGMVFLLSNMQCGFPNRRDLAEQEEEDGNAVNVEQMLLDPISPTQRLVAPVDMYMASLDSFLFWAGCVGHVFLLLYIIGALWPSYKLDSSSAQAIPVISVSEADGILSRTTSSVRHYSDVLTIILKDEITHILIAIPFLYISAVYLNTNTYIRTKLSTHILSGLATTIVSWRLAYLYGDRRVITDLSWLSLFIGWPVALWYAVMVLGDRYPGVAEQLLLFTPGSKQDGRQMDYEACAYFLGSVYTAVLSGLY